MLDEALDVTLVEDVITTGGAVQAATVALREVRAAVHVVVCAIDRSEPGANLQRGLGLETRAVLTRADFDRTHDDPR